jgi:hypothetical protein
MINWILHFQSTLRNGRNYDSHGKFYALIDVRSWRGIAFDRLDVMQVIDNLDWLKLLFGGRPLLQPLQVLRIRILRDVIADWTVGAPIT